MENANIYLNTSYWAKVSVWFFYHFNFERNYDVSKEESRGLLFNKKVKYVWLFYHFNFGRNYDVSKAESRCLLFNKKVNFNKTKTESKMEISRMLLERQTLYFSSYKIRESKIKLWWVEIRKREKNAFFLTFCFCPKKICVTLVFYLNV